MFRSSKKTTRRSHNRQQWGYESLEKKEMMAGNVSAAIYGKDPFGNVIELYEIRDARIAQLARTLAPS